MSIGPYNPQGSDTAPAPGSQSTPSPDTSLTTPVQSPSATTAQQAGEQAQFVVLAKAKLQAMIGTRYYLVDDATLTDIANKLWQSVTIQQLMAGYQQSPSLYAASLEAQIQNTILNPTSDPSVDPTITSDYITAKQSAGESLTTAELTAMASATQAANAPVPRPFDSQTVSGYDFGAPMPKGGWSSKEPGQSFGWQTHNGVDYGTPVGSRIVSPFAGTVHVQTGVPGYGNYVTVTLDNGWKIGFGHVQSGAAQDGARVNPGDLIAISGANVGSAQGAVTIVTWQDPQGNYANPHQVLDPIFKGTTFSSLPSGVPGETMAGAAGTGSPSVNAVLDREYPSIKTDWTTMFGSPPSPEDVYNVLQHGTSPTQWTDYIRSMPGHILGMSVGSIYDLRSVVDSVSMTALGHAGTDGIVKELNDQGMTSQAQVKLWYDEHSPNEIEKPVYDKIATALKPDLEGALNEKGVDPRLVKAVHDHAQSGTQGGGGYTP